MYAISQTFYLYYSFDSLQGSMRYIQMPRFTDEEIKAHND